MPSRGKVLKERWIRKDMEVSSRGLSFSWRDLRNDENLVHVTRDPAEIRTEYLPNMRPKRDLCASPSVHSNYSLLI
jgi:hypothetical protein